MLPASATCLRGPAVNCGHSGGYATPRSWGFSAFAFSLVAQPVAWTNRNEIADRIITNITTFLLSNQKNLANSFGDNISAPADPAHTSVDELSLRAETQSQAVVVVLLLVVVVVVVVRQCVVEILVVS